MKGLCAGFIIRSRIHPRGKPRGILRADNKTEFARKIFAVVSKIPRGKVLTYKQVAWRAGKSRAYRAVGNILAKNFDSSIPCHRVVRSDGNVGGYNRGEEKKFKILKREGTLSRGNKVAL